jgi:hypothetical protein
MPLGELREMLARGDDEDDLGLHNVCLRVVDCE